MEKAKFTLKVLALLLLLPAIFIGNIVHNSPRALPSNEIPTENVSKKIPGQPVVIEQEVTLKDI